MLDTYIGIFENTINAHINSFPVFQILFEISWVIISLIIALVISRFYQNIISQNLQENQNNKKDLAQRLGTIKKRLAYPIILTCLLLLYLPIAKTLSYPSNLVYLISCLSIAFIIIRFVMNFFENNVFSRMITWVIWIAVALKVTDMSDVTYQSLESIRFSIGQFDTSLWIIIKTLVVFLVLIWISVQMVRIFDSWVKRVDEFSPSHRVLAQKFFRVFVTISILIFGLNSIGVEIQTLAIFSGAIGVGLGFGMQKVVSNFISGIILLLDRSIKPGDVIAVGSTQGGGEKDVFGWVRSLGARYVSIITRDGKEHLIPNELLITDHVENWSHSNDQIRLKIPFIITYDSDVEKALEILVESANARPRVVNKNKTGARVLELSDEGVKMQLRVWISDPVNGVVNVRSFILRDIIKRFKEEGIKVPYRMQELMIGDISDEVIAKLGLIIKSKNKTK